MEEFSENYLTIKNVTIIHRVLVNDIEEYVEWKL